MGANKEIQAKLAEVRDRIRRVQWLRGALITGTIAIAGLLLIMASDYFFAPLASAVRWGLFSAWLVAIGYAGKVGFTPLFRKISLIQIARWIEVRHPEIQERMSTVLELDSQKNSHSQELIDALGLAAHQDIQSLDPKTEIRLAATRKKWTRPAFALIAILALVLVIWPQQSGRLLVRAVAPFSDLGNAGAAAFIIEPGSIEIFSGDEVTIKIRKTGPAKTLDLWINREGKEPLSQTLKRTEKDFIYHLDPVTDSFRYFAREGRAQSDAFVVSVLPVPEMMDPQLTLDFLPYTDLARRSLSLDGGIEVIEGTGVTLSSPINTRLESAWIDIEGKRISDGKVETSASGGRISFSWRIAREHTGEAIVTAKHHTGREFELGRFPVEALPDLDPQVTLVSPSPEEIKVRYDERVPMRYEVVEDFALAEVKLELDAGGDRQAQISQDLPIRRPGNAKLPVFQGHADIAVGQIRRMFEGVNEVRVRIVATDNRPADLSEGPGVGQSRWLNLKFEHGAESLARQELRAEHENALEKIEESIREVRETKDQLASLEGEIRKEKMEEWALEKFEKNNRKLAVTEEKISELAGQMEGSIHSAKADKIAKAAEKTQQALDESESAPLQENADKRQETLRQARKSAEEAIRDLEQVREAIRKDQPRVEDLARFQELAQHQQELARQAEENLRMPMTAEQLKDWQQQQEQMRQQLAEQLKQRPQALAKALADQAEQAKALAESAQELARNQEQLKEQAENSLSTAVNEDAVRKALAEAQESIAKEAQSQLDQALHEQSQIADTLPEATASATASLAQIRENKPAAAAESARKAKESLERAAELSNPAKTAESTADDLDPTALSPKNLDQAAQSQALSELSDRQETVANALDDIAEGNLEKAFQAVQTLQAEAVAQLAESLEALPQIDPTGTMQQASQSASQAAQAAESASREGRQGQQQAAAPQHAQSSQQLEQTAQKLSQAASNLAKAAEAASQKSSNSQQAPVSPENLAAAAAAAAKAASTGQSAVSAQSAQQAADGLAQAAQSAREKMSGKPSQPGPKGLPGLPQQPGDEPSSDPSRQPLPDPGVPPELAKLGISADDWEEIQATLGSDKGGAGIDGVPADYRDLVKGYFKSMSQK